jgi:hypothetical protein
MGKKSGFGSEMNNPDHIFREPRNKNKFLILNSLMRTWDPGWKQSSSGIRDKHPGSATLLTRKEIGWGDGEMGQVVKGACSYVSLYWLGKG